MGPLENIQELLIESVLFQKKIQLVVSLEVYDEAVSPTVIFYWMLVLYVQRPDTDTLK